MWENVVRFLDSRGRCPACGEPIIVFCEVQGYDEDHCQDCAQMIERRRSWLDGEGRAGAA